MLHNCCMGELKRAQVGDAGHTHIVYLADDGTGMSTKVEKHTHAMLAQPNEMGQVDWVMEPGPDGHDHELADLEEKDPTDYLKAQDDNEKVTEVHDLYRAAMRLEQDSIKAGEENWRFYLNDQWDAEDRASLREKGRFCLTINEVKPLVNLLTGFQKQNITDPIIKPFEASDDKSAEVANICLKHVLNKNNYEDEKSDVFMDQVIPGRGVFHVRWDDENADEGDIKVEQMMWDKPKFGPHIKKDARDLEYVVLTDKLSKYKINRLYPDKADEITAWIGSDTDVAPHVQPLPGHSFDFDSKKTLPMEDGKEEHLLIAQKNIMVFELWRKEYRRVPVVTRKSDAFVEDLSVLDVTAKEAKAVGAMEGFDLVYKIAIDMRVTKVAGQVLLDDEIIDESDFEVFPVYADKYKDMFQGWVEILKDPNRELNKRQSQLSDAMVSMNGARFIKRGSFTPDELKKYEAHGSEWNKAFITEDSSDKSPVVREEQLQVPSLLVNMAEYSSQKIRDISNMRDVAGLAGQGSSNMSGRALIIQRRTMMAGNDYLFDHMAATERRVARRIIQLIQEHYSIERMARIIQPNNNERMQEGQPAITIQDIQAFKENKDLTKYDIVIEESQHSRSLRDIIFNTMVEMMGQGITDIDTKDVFRFSSFPATIKEQIIAGIDQRRQAMQQQEQEKYQSQERMSQPDELKLAQAQATAAQQQEGF